MKLSMLRMEIPCRGASYVTKETERNMRSIKERMINMLRNLYARHKHKYMVVHNFKFETS